MREIEVPSLSSSMEHFRKEVAQRAARQTLRHRRLVGGSIGVGLLLVSAVSLLIVGPGTPTEHRASSSASRASAAAVPSPSQRLPRGSASSGTAADSGTPHFSPGNSAAGVRCPPHSVCLNADALEAGLHRQSAGAPAAAGSPLSLARGFSSVNLPSDGTLELGLTSSTSKQWGVPKITQGTVLKRRLSQLSPDGTLTTEFVPVTRSGTAVISVSCAGVGCQSSSYSIEVTVSPAAKR